MIIEIFATVDPKTLRNIGPFKTAVLLNVFFFFFIPIHILRTSRIFKLKIILYDFIVMPNLFALNFDIRFEFLIKLLLRTVRISNIKIVFTLLS